MVKKKFKSTFDLRGTHEKPEEREPQPESKSESPEAKIRQESRKPSTKKFSDFT